FFSNTPAPPTPSTPSLHDALPIFGIAFASGGQTVPATQPTDPVNIATGNPITVQISWLGDVLTTNGVVPSPLQVTLTDTTAGTRSEEHTSELQSQSNLVCRLLLEK